MLRKLWDVSAINISGISRDLFIRDSMTHKFKTDKIIGADLAHGHVQDCLVTATI